MPLPFEEFEGKGVLDFSFASDLLTQNHHPVQKLNTHQEESCYVGTEPTSVLDTGRSPSPPSSTSTLSSSLGGGNGGFGSADTNVTAIGSENPPILEEKCGLGMGDWDCVLSESHVREPAILRLIMSDIEDPSFGLNKLLNSGNGTPQDLEFNGDFGVVDNDFMFDNNLSAASNLVNIDDPFLQGQIFSDFHFESHENVLQSNNNNVRLDPVLNLNPSFSASSATNLLPASFAPDVFQGDEKPQIFNSHAMNQNQAQKMVIQNPSMFMPLTYAQLQEHQLLSPPPSKRLNSSAMGPKYQHFQPQQQVQLVPHYFQQSATMAAIKHKVVGDESVNQQLQQEIINQLFKAAELIEARNPLLVQGILARLNQQLSPNAIGKPFQRASFYFKEALQLLLSNSIPTTPTSPFDLIFKIGAYKSFSEISPILQFSNFTSNQVILEAFEGFERIHIIDFDIGFGGQWASFMQELSLRNGGATSLKITAFVSPSSSYDKFELDFTRENLERFASDLNIAFVLNMIPFDSLLNSGSWPLPHNVPANESIAVNFPFGSISNSLLSSLPLVLRFVKQISPKIIVCLDRDCNRMDCRFPQHILNALQSYWGLFESLDAVNMNLEAQQKIEKYFLQPEIENIVLGRHKFPEITPPWTSLFMSSGFTPLTFSNFTESQADCLLQRTPVRGFHIDKRHGSLVLCWQGKELVSVSAWRC